MKTDVKGCSTCPRGQEQYEEYEVTFGRGRGTTRFSYDYRTADGELFATDEKTLEECRRKRDEWLAKREGRKCES